VPSCRQLHGLHGTALPRTVQYLQLRHDDLLDKRVRLGGEHVAMRVLLEDLDARPVHQESIVQDKEVVIKNAECVTLRAFVNDNLIVDKIIDRTDNVKDGTKNFTFNFLNIRIS